MRSLALESIHSGYLQLENLAQACKKRDPVIDRWIDNMSKNIDNQFIEKAALKAIEEQDRFIAKATEIHSDLDRLEAIRVGKPVAIEGGAKRD